MKTNNYLKKPLPHMSWLRLDTPDFMARLYYTASYTVLFNPLSLIRSLNTFGYSSIAESGIKATRDN